MEDYAAQNKMAWEYDAYNFWVSQSTPYETAKKNLENPRNCLRYHAEYFENAKGMTIANICGSCGKRAVPLAILGANVSVFDISEQNKKYACEAAEAAGVNINYVVGDVLDIDMSVYGGYFDAAYMEGGILHYFHDINKFMSVIYNIIKPGARLILSDFHPFGKIMGTLSSGGLKEDADYFATGIAEAEMPHAGYYSEEQRKLFPRCLVRRYTLSEIINAVLNAGFILKSFDEHPSWTNAKLPGEYTILAVELPVPAAPTATNLPVVTPPSSHSP